MSEKSRKTPGVRIRQVAVLVAMALLASMLVSGPNAETPAYGLSDAGFIDGIPLHEGTYGAILVDSAANRVLFGTTPGQSFLNPATRRAYFPGASWNDRAGPSCIITAPSSADIDSVQPVPSILVGGQSSCYDGDLWAADAAHRQIYYYDRFPYHTLRVFDADSHAEIGAPAFITDTYAGNEAFDLQARRLTLVERNLALQWPNPTAYPYRVWSVDIDTKSIAADTSLSATYPCRAAANPATNRIYIANEQPGEVMVLDGNTLTELARVPVASHLGLARRNYDMCALAVNPATNRIYLLRAEGPQYEPPSWGGPTGAKLVVIDGDSNQVVDEIDVADARAVFQANLAVDPVTSRIFVGVPTLETPNRVQVFVDATPDTIQNIQQTGRYTQWFFAEGTTRQGFRTFLTLYSPDTPNRVRISYLTGPGQGGPYFQEVDLPANTRITVDVGAVTGPGRDVSTRIVSLYDKPFFAERPMYFDTSAGLGTGGTTGTGQHN